MGKMKITSGKKSRINWLVINNCFVWLAMIFVYLVLFGVFNV